MNTNSLSAPITIPLIPEHAWYHTPPPVERNDLNPAMGIIVGTIGGIIAWIGIRAVVYFIEMCVG